jgi:hypothetical protein
MTMYLEMNDCNKDLLLLLLLLLKQINFLRSYSVCFDLEL